MRNRNVLPQKVEQLRAYALFESGHFYYARGEKLNLESEGRTAEAFQAIKTLPWITSAKKNQR